MRNGDEGRGHYRSARGRAGLGRLRMSEMRASDERVDSARAQRRTVKLLLAWEPSANFGILNGFWICLFSAPPENIEIPLVTARFSPALPCLESFNMSAVYPGYYSRVCLS